MNTSRAKLISCLLGLIIAVGKNARAEECRTPLDSPALIASKEARLDFIRRQMDHSAHNARIWTGMWVSIYGGVAAVELALYPVNSAAARIDAWYGAGSSLVGVAAIAFLPPKVMGDQRWLARELQKPRDSDEEKCRLLGEAERRFISDARDQEFSQGPVVHLGAFVFNFTVAMVLQFVHNHFDAALEQLLVGEVVAEIQIATAPNDLPSALEQYRSGNLHAPPKKFHWALAPSAGLKGLQLNFQF